MGSDQRRPNEDSPRPRAEQVWRRKRDGMLVRVLKRRSGWIVAYDGEYGQSTGRGMTELAFVESHDFEKQR